MMNRAPILSFAAAAAFSLFVAGCGGSLVPFTHETRIENNLTVEEVKNLQFYVSHRITLRRELESGGRQITGSHKLLVVSGKTIEEVVIEEKTPGIAVAVGDAAISVSFEQGTSMEFSARDGRLVSDSSSSPQVGSGSFAQAPDPFPGNNPDRQPDNFTPSPSASGSFTGNYFLNIEPGGRITFETKSFEAVEDSFKAHLMIDSDTLEDVVKNRKVLPGLRLK
jgi:hypothetical protein